MRQVALRLEDNFKGRTKLSPFAKRIHSTVFLDAARETNFDLSATQTQIGGLPFAAGENSEYQRYFIENHFKTWLLVSAIGFKGLLVAKDVRQAS